MFPIYYRNEWGLPSSDERWEGLLHIADAIYATHESLSEAPRAELAGLIPQDTRAVLSPLELTALLQRAVDRIHGMTRAQVH